MVEYAKTKCVINLFSDSDAKSDLITQINTNMDVAVLEHGCMWCKIIKDSYVGFCKTKHLEFENSSKDFQSKESSITISIPRDCACALCNALKFSLELQ